MVNLHIPQSFRLQAPVGGRFIDVHCDSKGLQIDGEQVIDWKRLTNVNLNLVLASKYNAPHYLCRISTTDGEVQIKADLDQVGAGLEYRQFLLYIHHQLIASRSRATFTKGMRNAWSYHLLRLGTLGVFVGLEILFIYAITTRGKVGLGILFMLVTAAAGYWFYNLVRHSLQPKTYDPAEIPWDMLPPE